MPKTCEKIFINHRIKREYFNLIPVDEKGVKKVTDFFDRLLDEKFKNVLVSSIEKYDTEA